MNQNLQTTITKQLIEGVPLNRRPFSINGVSYLHNGTLSVLQPYTDVSQSDVLLFEAVGFQFRSQLCCTLPSATKTTSSSLASTSATTSTSTTTSSSSSQTTSIHGHLISRTSIVDANAITAVNKFLNSRKVILFFLSFFKTKQNVSIIEQTK